MFWFPHPSLLRLVEPAAGRIASLYGAPLALRLSIAAATVALATAFRLAVLPPLGAALPYATYYLAVEISALLGGLAPGLFAIATSALAAHILFAPMRTATDEIGLALFVSSCALLVAMTELLRRTRLPLIDARAPRMDAACGLIDAAHILEQFALAAPGVIGSFYFDPKGCVACRYLSSKAKDIFGLGPQEISANPGVFLKRLDRGDLKKINEGLSRSTRDLTLWVVEFRFRHPEKGSIWIEARAIPEREPDGRLIWHGYASDITERKHAGLALAESGERLQATIDAAPDAVLTMDAGGRILSMNPAGERTFGYAAGEIVGKHARALIEDTGPETLLTPTGGRSEITALRKSGEPFPAELTLASTRLEGQPLLVAFVKDLTEQRDIERRIQELHRDRFAETGGMAAALAHEINQPLAATTTYLGVARRIVQKSPLADDPTLTGVLEKAAAQTLRAGKIVASLRDLIRRGEADKTLISVNELVREARDALLADAPDADIHITVNCLAEQDKLVGDRTQMRQLLANLIRNAIEAMKSEDRRDLILKTSNPDDQTIRVDVIDTGSGLPDSSEEGCFEPFTSTKARGMGVDLSISRSIIEAHYGRIWAAPNHGGGAIFSFALPLQRADMD